MAVVFDCSVTLAWFLKDERTAFTDTAFELMETAEGWVPFVWRLEFPNALLFAERKKRIGRLLRRHILEQAPRLRNEAATCAPRSLLVGPTDAPGTSEDVTVVLLTEPIHRVLSHVDGGRPRATTAARVRLLALGTAIRGPEPPHVPDLPPPARFVIRTRTHTYAFA